MNTTPTITPDAKNDGKQSAIPTAVVANPAACATTSTSPLKAEACATSSDKPECNAKTHDGKVVSITGNKLVMSNHDGKEYSHTVAADAKVCCDGTICRTEDLKVGSKIRLTTKSDDKNVATKIESLDKKAEFASAV